MSRTSFFIVFAALSLIAGVTAGCSAKKVPAASAMGMPAVPVTVATAMKESVPLELRVIGNVEASSTVQVKSMVDGQLMSVHFAEGQDVEKGQLLFEIDPRPYQEALRQSQAALEKDRALLRQNEANLERDRVQSKNASADAGRYSQLAKEGVVSRQQSEQSQSTADALSESIRADQAGIESARASLNSDAAAIDKAKLDLAYCSIRSPLSGRAGNLLVHPGNLVKANDTNALVVINKLAPIFVNFSVPEQSLDAVRKNSQNGKLAVDVSPQDGSGATEKGYLSVIDNTVDMNTGTIKLKAVFDNEHHVLWPGQFVNVVLVLSTLRDATVIPAEAVQAGQQGQFIYVVKTDKTVEPRIVTVGRTLDRKVIIEKGVTPGETVVTDGQLRLYPGARIEEVPPVKPALGVAQT